jgi:hypothetical protein
MDYQKVKHGIKIVFYYSLALICSIVWGVGTDSTLAAGPPKSFPGGKRGQEAIASLGERLPAVASRYILSVAQLRARFLRDADLHLDPTDKLVYLCSFNLPEGSSLAEESGQGPLNGPLPYDQTFQLHSVPGASKVIYLDFDGHVTSGTIWNGGADINSEPYDIDGDTSSFSNTELDRIQYIWQRVAEDFAMYNIDVTTEDPGMEDLRRSGSGDAHYGTRVVVSPSSSWFGSAGGVAYVGSFNWGSDTPCFVFSNHLGNGNEKYVSEASSHEVGHTLGLYHDGKSGGTEYYAGHFDWAPIMGVGYYKPITQWSKGEYTGANNTEDDLARMQNFGASYLSDDHGNSTSNATPLSGVNLSGSGIIEQRTDVDVFSFQTDAGDITINVDPAPRDVNLDVKLQLLNSSGGVVAEKDEFNVSTESLSVNVNAGTYFIRIDGVGTGDPNTGYTDYASIGQYFISGTVVDNGANDPPAFTSDPINEVDGMENELYSSTLADDATDPENDTLTFSKISGPAWLEVAADGMLLGTPGTDDVDLNSWTVGINDGYGGSDQATLEIFVVEQPPTHSNDSIAESIRERTSGGKPNNRHSYLEHKWLFDVQPGMAQTFFANVWAPVSSDDDTFIFSYSSDDATYKDMFTVQANVDNSTYQTFTFPVTQSGTVYVKVVDTDQTPGNRAKDTVYVDHMFIRTDMGLGDPPLAPSGLTATALSSSEIDLSWTDNSEDEAGFTIKRSLSETDGFSAVGTAGPGATSYTDTGLQPETTYYYQVQAFNGSGISNYSNTASATTDQAETNTVHVGDLDGSSTPGNRNRWTATVTVTVNSASGMVQGAIVSGIWSSGVNGSGTCTTGGNGWCGITKNNIKGNNSNVTFTVTDIVPGSGTYDSGSNSDPDGDSDGTRIIVNKP